MSNYYIAKPGTQQPMGPMSIDQIRAGIQQGTITPDCVYCAIGMQQWLPVAQLPGLNTPHAGCTPRPGYRSVAGGKKLSTASCPNSGLASSILVTIFCCIPFGILAIVNSARCNALIAEGDYATARRAASRAGTWRERAIISYVIFWVATIILLFIDVFFE